MNCVFQPGFDRDLKRLDRPIRQAILHPVDQICAVATVADIAQLKRMKGKSGFYRVRVGDYRIGIHIDGDTVTFVRCLHRREIYRVFP